MDITIQPALPEQAAALSDVAFRAKGYWGYAADQMEQWRIEFLTITSTYIEANTVWIAVVDAQQIAGFAAVEQHGEEAILDHLWVLPDYIGQGIGKRLFQHVAVTTPEFTFTSDPHADAFYRKMGAQKIGEYQSGLQGRVLTKFKYTSK